jgi:hypothetical protein
LVGQGVKVSDSGVAFGDEGVLDAARCWVGVMLAITVGVSSTDKLSVAADGVAVTVCVDAKGGVISRRENNQ